MMRILSLFLVLAILTHTHAWKFTNKMRVSAVGVGIMLIASPAYADSANGKAAFINQANQGAAAADIRRVDDNLAKEKLQEKKDEEAFTPSMTGVRLIDLGGNRGARGLAASSDMVSGGSLVDQLKAYGGPGASEDKDGDKVTLVNGKKQRIDNSLKNPLKYSNEFEEQLKMYQKMQGGK